MKHSVVAVLTGLLVLFGVNTSLAKDWLVDRVSGTAWAASSPHHHFQLKPQMMVAEGLTITTSGNGRVRLVNGSSSLTLSPRSVAVLVSRGLFVRTTQVIQQVGMIEFDVEKRSRPHLVIETPYLAAVVKGTKFTVTVSKSTATVNVERGLVHATDLASGESAEVGKGQRAASREDAAGLITAGKTVPDIVQGTPLAPAVAPRGRDLRTFRDNRAELPSLGAESDQKARGASGKGEGKGKGSDAGKSGRKGKGGGSDSDGGKGGKDHGGSGKGDGSGSKGGGHGGGGKDGKGGSGKGGGQGGGGKDGKGGSGKGGGHSDGDGHDG